MSTATTELAFSLPALQKQMKYCDELSADMLQLLEGFENTLMSLEKTILPLQAQTKSLTVAQKNIDSAIAETEAVIHYDQIAEGIQEGEEREEKTRDITRDWRAYLHWADQLREAISYFCHCNAFKDQKDKLAKLRKNSEKALAQCGAEFKKLLKKYDMSTTQVSPPCPESIVIMSDAMEERLGRIAGCMDRLGDESYVTVLSEGTKESVEGALKYLQSAYKSEKQKSPSEQKVGRYEKGSHRLLFHLEFFCKLLKGQYALWRGILHHCPSFLDSDRDLPIFNNVVRSSVKGLMNNTLSALQKDKSLNSLLVALDVLGKLGDLMPHYRKILRSTNDYKPLLELRRKLTGYAQEALCNYREYVIGFEVNKSSIKNGTVHPLSIETLNFLKRLYDYHGVIHTIETSSLIPQEVKYDFQSSRGTNMRPIILLIIGALETNLQHAAKGFKSKALSHIFLLNNYHQIQEQVNALEFDIGPEWQAACTKAINKAQVGYQDASWGKIRELLDAKALHQLKAECVEAQKHVKLGGKVKIPRSTCRGIKTRLLAFSDQFDKVMKEQRYVIAVPDQALRRELRVQNAAIVVPLYKLANDLFYDVQFYTKVTSRNKYLRWDVSSFEILLQNCFEERISDRR